jgi:putative sterol carrier protein
MEGRMADVTEKFFEDLGARGQDPRLASVRGTLRFDLMNGKRVARWTVAIDKGDVAVTRRNARADCVVRAKKRLFDGIASGEVNPLSAVLRGEMGVEGEPELLVFFQRLFPAPRKKQ